MKTTTKITRLIVTILSTLILLSCGSGGGGAGSGGGITPAPTPTPTPILLKNPTEPSTASYNYVIPNGSGSSVVGAESNIGIYQGTNSSYQISIVGSDSESSYLFSIPQVVVSEKTQTSFIKSVLSSLGLVKTVAVNLPIITTNPSPCNLSGTNTCSLVIDTTNTAPGIYTITPKIGSFTMPAITITVLQSTTTNPIVAGGLIFNTHNYNIINGTTNNVVLSLDASSNVTNLDVKLNSDNNTVTSITPSSCILSTNNNSCNVTINASDTNSGSANINVNANGYKTTTLPIVVTPNPGTLLFDTNNLALSIGNTTKTNLSLKNHNGVFKVVANFTPEDKNVTLSPTQCILTVSNNFSCEVNVVGNTVGTTYIDVSSVGYNVTPLPVAINPIRGVINVTGFSGNGLDLISGQSKAVTISLDGSSGITNTNPVTVNLVNESDGYSLSTTTCKLDSTNNTCSVNVTGNMEGVSGLQVLANWDNYQYPDNILSVSTTPILGTLAFSGNSFSELIGTTNPISLNLIGSSGVRGRIIQFTTDGTSTYSIDKATCLISSTSPCNVNISAGGVSTTSSSLLATSSIEPSLSATLPIIITTQNPGNLAFNTNNINLNSGQNQVVLLSLANSVGVGNLPVNIISTDPSIVNINNSSCNLSSIGTTCQVTLNGVTEGTAKIIASANGYTATTMNITTTAQAGNLAFYNLSTATPINVNSGESFVIQLIATNSLGIRVRQINLSSSNPSILSVNPTCSLSSTQGCNVNVSTLVSGLAQITAIDPSGYLTPITLSVNITPASLGHLSLNINKTDGYESINVTSGQIYNAQLSLNGSSGVSSTNVTLQSLNPNQAVTLESTCVLSSNNPSCLIHVKAINEGFGTIQATSTGLNIPSANLGINTSPIMGHLIVNKLSESLVANASDDITLTLESSLGVISRTINLQSDNTVATTNPTTCILSSASNSCTFNITGVSSGQTQLNMVDSQGTISPISLPVSVSPQTFGTLSIVNSGGTSSSSLNSGSSQALTVKLTNSVGVNNLPISIQSMDSTTANTIESGCLLSTSNSYTCTVQVNANLESTTQIIVSSNYFGNNYLTSYTLQSVALIGNLASSITQAILPATTTESFVISLNPGTGVRNRKINLQSNNLAIATVSPAQCDISATNGCIVTVSGISSGTTTIAISESQDSLNLTVPVTIKPANLGSLSLQYNGSSNTTINSGDTQTLTLSLNGSTGVGNTTINFASSDLSSITINPNSCVVSSNTPTCSVDISGILESANTSISATESTGDYQVAVLNAVVKAVSGTLKFNKTSESMLSNTSISESVQLIGSKGVRSRNIAITTANTSMANIINNTCTNLSTANPICNVTINALSYGSNGNTIISATNIEDNLTATLPLHVGVANYGTLSITSSGSSTTTISAGSSNNIATINLNGSIGVSNMPITITAINPISNAVSVVESSCLISDNGSCLVHINGITGATGSVLVSSNYAGFTYSAILQVNVNPVTGHMILVNNNNNQKINSLNYVSGNSIPVTVNLESSFGVLTRTLQITSSNASVANTSLITSSCTVSSAGSTNCQFNLNLNGSGTATISVADITSGIDTTVRESTISLPITVTPLNTGTLVLNVTNNSIKSGNTESAIITLYGTGVNAFSLNIKSLDTQSLTIAESMCNISAVNGPGSCVIHITGVLESSGAIINLMGNEPSGSNYNVSNAIVVNPVVGHLKFTENNDINAKAVSSESMISGNIKPIYVWLESSIGVRSRNISISSANTTVATTTGNTSCVLSSQVTGNCIFNLNSISSGNINVTSQDSTILPFNTWQESVVQLAVTVVPNSYGKLRFNISNMTIATGTTHQLLLKLESSSGVSNEIVNITNNNIGTIKFAGLDTTTCNLSDKNPSCTINISTEQNVMNAGGDTVTISATAVDSQTIPTTSTITIKPVQYGQISLSGANQIVAGSGNLVPLTLTYANSFGVESTLVNFTTSESNTVIDSSTPKCYIADTLNTCTVYVKANANPLNPTTTITATPVDSNVTATTSTLKVAPSTIGSISFSTISLTTNGSQNVTLSLNNSVGMYPVSFVVSANDPAMISIPQNTVCNLSNSKPNCTFTMTVNYAGSGYLTATPINGNTIYNKVNSNTFNILPYKVGELAMGTGSNWQTNNNITINAGSVVSGTIGLISNPSGNRPTMVTMPNDTTTPPSTMPIANITLNDPNCMVTDTNTCGFNIIGLRAGSITYTETLDSKTVSFTINVTTNASSSNIKWLSNNRYLRYNDYFSMVAMQQISVLYLDGSVSGANIVVNNFNPSSSIANFMNFRGAAGGDNGQPLSDVNQFEIVTMYDSRFNGVSKTPDYIAPGSMRPFSLTPTATEITIPNYTGNYYNDSNNSCDSGVTGDVHLLTPKVMFVNGDSPDYYAYLVYLGGSGYCSYYAPYKVYSPSLMPTTNTVLNAYYNIGQYNLNSATASAGFIYVAADYDSTKANLLLPTTQHINKTIYAYDFKANLSSINTTLNTSTNITFTLNGNSMLGNSYPDADFGTFTMPSSVTPVFQSIGGVVKLNSTACTFTNGINSCTISITPSSVGAGTITAQLTILGRTVTRNINVNVTNGGIITMPNPTSLAIGTGITESINLTNVFQSTVVSFTSSESRVSVTPNCTVTNTTPTCNISIVANQNISANESVVITASAPNYTNVTQVITVGAPNPGTLSFSNLPIGNVINNIGGESTPITLNLLNSFGESDNVVSFTSSNTTSITVESQCNISSNNPSCTIYVKGLSRGTSTITAQAKIGGVDRSAIVTLTAGNLGFAKFSVSSESFTSPGSTQNVSLGLYGATVFESQTFSIISSNPSVVTAGPSTCTLLNNTSSCQVMLTAIGIGNAVICATNLQTGQITDNINVSVANNNPTVLLYFNSSHLTMAPNQVNVPISIGVLGGTVNSVTLTESGDNVVTLGNGNNPLTISCTNNQCNTTLSSGNAIGNTYITATATGVTPASVSVSVTTNTPSLSFMNKFESLGVNQPDTVTLILNNANLVTQAISVTITSNNLSVVSFPNTLNNSYTCTFSGTQNSCQIPIVAGSTLNSQALLQVSNNSLNSTPTLPVYVVPYSAGTITFNPQTSNVVQGNFESVTLSLIGSSGVPNSYVSFTSESSAIAIESGNCLLSSSNSNCTVFITGNAIGSTRIHAQLTGYVDAIESVNVTAQGSATTGTLRYNVANITMNSNSSTQVTLLLESSVGYTATSPLKVSLSALAITGGTISFLPTSCKLTSSNISNSCIITITESGNVASNQITTISATRTGNGNNPTLSATINQANSTPLVIAYFNNSSVYQNNNSLVSEGNGPGRAIANPSYMMVNSANTLAPFNHGIQGNYNTPNGITANSDMQTKLAGLNVLIYGFLKIDPNGNLQLQDPWSELNPNTDTILCNNMPIFCQNISTSQSTFPWAVKGGMFSAFAGTNNAIPSSVKRYIAIGGWQGTMFTTSLSSANQIAQFESSLSALVSFYPNIKGIDFDIENNPAVFSSSQEFYDYINTVFPQIVTAITGGSATKNLEIALTIAGNPEVIRNLTPTINSQITKLSHINLMTYDFHGAWDIATGTNFNSNLYMPDNSNDTNPFATTSADLSVDAVVQAIESIIPAGTSQKINIGLVTHSGTAVAYLPDGGNYGMYQTGVNYIIPGDTDIAGCVNSLGNMNTCSGQFSNNYLVTNMLNKTTIFTPKYWTKTINGTTYNVGTSLYAVGVWNANTYGGLNINGNIGYGPMTAYPSTLAQIFIPYTSGRDAWSYGKYTRQHNLGGAIIWDIGTDAPYSDINNSIIYNFRQGMSANY